MKRVLFEVAFVIVCSGLFLQFQAARVPIAIGLIAIGVWVIPIQILLSVSLTNWLNEFGGKYLGLPWEKRMVQIRSTFEGLTEVESVKLRWFYIQACIFHYLMMLLVAFGFILVAVFFLMGGINSNDIYKPTIGILGAILAATSGYFIFPKFYPPHVKRNLEETFHLFLKKDWRKRLFKEETAPTDISLPKTFYDFWLQGKSLTEKTAAFDEFIKLVNSRSRDGILLDKNEEGKLEIKCVIHAKALSKSLAGFLKYCIEDRGVLSDEILRHRYRELLREVFSLEDLKNLVFLEGQRFKSTPPEYVNVYRST